ARVLGFLWERVWEVMGSSLSSGGVDMTEILEFKTLRDRYGMSDSTRVSVSLGEIFLEGNKSWESNIGESDNTGDEGKIAGREITT
nr:hypothetical protein [Tanacetum cinerariifolium]